MTRKRNSGFSNLLPKTHPLTIQSSSNGDSSSEEQIQQGNLAPNRNSKKVEPANDSGSDARALIGEY